MSNELLILRPHEFVLCAVCVLIFVLFLDWNTPPIAPFACPAQQVY